MREVYGFLPWITYDFIVPLRGVRLGVAGRGGAPPNAITKEVPAVTRPVRVELVVLAAIKVVHDDMYFQW